ncbi:hypothetical protein HYW17_01040 [Candidatus Uhrbacteria bacterium]|nr:hypothetical protein [Candidatus Uhrbacteria bacterium]
MGIENTFYLFAKPSFIEGVGRVLDLGGVLDTYNISTTPAEADAKALRTDWMAVGNDLRSAMQQYASQFSGVAR